MSPELRQMMEVLQGSWPDDVGFDVEAERDLRELRARRGLNDYKEMPFVNHVVLL